MSDIWTQGERLSKSDRTLVDRSVRTRPELGSDASDIWTRGERLSESDRTLAQWSDRTLMSFCSASGQSDIA